MPFGSLAGALGLAGLTFASHPVAYLAVWILLGAALAASLYDPAFATLGRIFGAAPAQPITVLTLAGGFASTVSWPATYALLQPLGWKGTYLVYAALLALVAAPLHAFALPRTRADADAKPADGAVAAAAGAAASGATFLLVVTAFAAYAFVPSGLSAHLLAIFQRAGIDAGTAVIIGALFGPSQVAARFGVDLRPQCPSAPIAASRSACWSLAFALLAAVRLLDPGRIRVRDHVRPRQRPFTIAAARCRSRCSGRRLRPHHRPHRPDGADRHRGRAGGGGIRGGTRLRCRGARPHRRLRGGGARLLSAECGADRSPSGGNAPGAGERARASRASSSMRRTSASTESNFSSGRIQPMNATSIGAP